MQLADIKRLDQTSHVLPSTVFVFALNLTLAFNVEEWAVHTGTKLGLKWNEPDRGRCSALACSSSSLDSPKRPDSHVAGPCWQTPKAAPLAWSACHCGTQRALILLCQAQSGPAHYTTSWETSGVYFGIKKWDNTFVECEMTTMHCGNIAQGLRKEQDRLSGVKALQPSFLPTSGEGIFFSSLSFSISSGPADLL